MLEALQKFRVDRNITVQTAVSAELAIAAPEKYTALLQQLANIAKRSQEVAE